MATDNFLNPFLTADISQMAADKDLSFRDCGTISYQPCGACFVLQAMPGYYFHRG